QRLTQLYISYCGEIDILNILDHCLVLRSLYISFSDICSPANLQTYTPATLATKTKADEYNNQ
ncbi:hypothetical protein F4703DRAFT_1919274, partial [Phycomyces blakesleeanus]